MGVSSTIKAHLFAILLVPIASGCTKAPRDITLVRLSCTTLPSSEASVATNVPDKFSLAFDLGSQQVLLLLGGDTSVEMLQEASPDELRLKTPMDINYSAEVTVARDGTATYIWRKSGTANVDQRRTATCD